MFTLLVLSACNSKGGEQNVGKTESSVQTEASATEGGQASRADKNTGVTGPLVIDFYATWCGPCKQMQPITDEVMQNNPNVKFMPVDVDANGQLAEKYQVRAVPTYIFVNKRGEQQRVEGAVSKEVFENCVKWTLAG